ncbi:Protein FAR1-RELATED SEQUENCE 12 [Ananas comosus]|uniref:Protein FAR1-RELATED SEQUENCE 12 n=1 Tax=Ananas comosus TaxID=4615 RepID=A0A199ULU4_ANACO|nr:Protein FAR1-RELATED SEQUENCE 12 [Ananas comosus]
MEIENDEPYVGQVFSSIDEAKRFYNIYAFKIGFSIRKATHYKAKRLDGLVTSITYTCSKEGHAKPPTQRKKQKKFLKLIELLRRSFQIEHNNELIVSPSKTHYFRSIAPLLMSKRKEECKISILRKDLSNTIVEKNMSRNGIDVASRYESKNLQECKMKDGQATLWTFNPIEEQARDVYTKNVFMDFRDQLKASTCYRLMQMKNIIYKVCIIQNSSKHHQRMYSYMVSIHEDDEKVSCNCKKFNYTGILCAHALTVMYFVGIHHIPQTI